MSESIVHSSERAVRNSTRALCLMLACAAFVLAAERSDGAVTVRVVPGDDRPGVPALRLLLYPADSAASKDDPRLRERALEGTSITLAEEPGSRWRASVVSPGWWSETVTLEFPPEPETRIVDIRLWPAATIRGRLAVPADDPAPTTLRVHAESPPDPERPPKIARGAAFDCSLGADRAWSCSAPAAVLDLVVRVDGYAPIYRWNVTLTPESTVDVGELRLERGASVTAWLDRDSRAQLEEAAAATLTRMVSEEASQTAARLRAPVAHATFDDEGLVQLVGLPAGTYVLTVTAKGFAAARAFPIEVFAGKETALRKSITLLRPMTLTFALRPPRDPAGKPWEIEVRRMNDFGTGSDPDGSIRRTADDEGRVVIADQAPGAFRIAVSDGARNVLVRRHLDVRDGADGEIPIDVPVKQVRGTVHFGDDPLRATLWFGGRNAAVSVRLDSDAEGAFAGSLPASGTWTVEVTSHAPKIDTIMTVDIGAEDEDVEIRIPDTTIRGVVADPAGGAAVLEVTAEAWGRPVTIRADAERRFVFRGLPEGTIRLRARDLRTGRSSATVETITAAGESREGVVLTLISTEQVAGRLMSGGRPVIGARINISPITTSGAAPQVRILSDEHGAFAADVPVTATRLRVVVSAPGRAFQVFELPVADAPLLLEIAAVGGTLDLSWPAGSFPHIAGNGVPLALPDLIAWSQRHGSFWQDGHLRVPNVAPGHYQLCIAAAGAKQPTCRDGVVAPAGTLTLAIPR